MSGRSSKDQAIQFIEATHTQLAKFAQESFGMHGRGLVLAEAPTLTPHTPTGLVMTSMIYHELADPRKMLGDISGDSRESTGITLRMVETYDPFKQAVVMVGFKHDNPVTVKMRLAEPMIEDGDSG